MTFRIGIISDTHGLLRPEAERALTGVDHIIHAGDIGRPEIVDALPRLAPATAIPGNVHRGEGDNGLARAADTSLRAAPGGAPGASPRCAGARRPRPPEEACNGAGGPAN